MKYRVGSIFSSVTKGDAPYATLQADGSLKHNRIPDCRYTTFENKWAVNRAIKKTIEKYPYLVKDSFNVEPV